MTRLNCYLKRERWSNERGSADIIFAIFIASGLMVAFGISQVAVSNRNDIVTKSLNGRALVQANNSALELLNSAIRSETIKMNIDSTTKQLKVIIPNGSLAKPSYAASGSSVTDFSFVACTPFLIGQSGDLSNYTAPAATPCTYNVAGKILSSVRINRYVTMNGKNFADATATTAYKNEQKRTRALVPFVPVATKKSCSLGSVYNWKYGCGPNAMQYFRVYIPGGTLAASNGYYVAAKADTKEVLFINYSRTNWGCQWGYRQPDYRFLVFTNPDDGITYDLPDPGATTSTADCELAMSSTSPLVLDLSDKGLNLSLPEDGPYFDMDGSGKQERYAWPRSKDAYYLVLPDKDGTPVKSIQQLFGNATVGPDGEQAENGFEALKKWLPPNVTVLDKNQPFFHKLRLWHDSNFNGLVDDGELFTLAAKGVKAISLDYKNTVIKADSQGSNIMQVSKIVNENGTEGSIVDLWPAKSEQKSQSSPSNDAEH